MERPAALKPLVGRRRWQRWLETFASIDTSSTGGISAKELVTTNVFSKEEALAIVSLLTPGGGKEISRCMFLTALLNCYGFRIADPDGRPLR